MLNVKVYNSTARKTLNKYDLFARVARRKRSSYKKNMAAHLRFVKLYLNKAQNFLHNVPWTDQTKVEICGHNAQQHMRQETVLAY